MAAARSSQAINGIVWAADNGAKVINMSLGGEGPCPAPMQSAIDYAWARGALVSQRPATGGLIGSAIHRPARPPTAIGC